MTDLQSIMGYAFNSPFRFNPYLDIQTPEGLIDMSNTPIDLLGIDNLGNTKKMKAGKKNPYKFKGTQVREIPIAQQGGNTYQQFYNDYLNSSTYKDRLIKSGYSNPEQVIKDRLENINSSKLISSDNSNAATPEKVFVNSADGPIEMVASHEYGHKSGANKIGYYPNPNLNLNPYENTQLNNWNKFRGQDSHLGKPWESKADIESLRYLMYHNNLGTPMDQMNSDRLQKAKDNKNIKGSTILNRLQQRYTDEDLIWLMNNIAGDQTQSSVAKLGGNYQRGGKTLPNVTVRSNKPEYVTDPNDPRIKKYQDSLNLYNSRTKAAYDLIRNSDIRLTDSAIVSPNIIADRRMPTSNYSLGLDPGDLEVMRLFGNMSEVEDLKNAPIKPVAFQEYGFRGEGDTSNTFPIYKKPVQPVVYRKPKRVLDVPLPDVVIPNMADSGNRPIPSRSQVTATNYQDIPSNYSFTYPTGKYNEQKTIYFQTPESWRDFNRNVKGVSSQEGSNYGTSTGYLKKGGNPFQKGGLTPQQMFNFLFDDEEETPKVDQQKIPTAPSVDEVDTAPSREDRLAANNLLAMQMIEPMVQENPYAVRTSKGNLGNPYMGEILSSGKFGNKNVGDYGRQIYGQLATDLGYSPQVNSIFRSRQQQDALIAAGAPAAKNSWHLSGNAIDLKPADWHKLSDQQQQYYRTNYDVVYHNNHYHIEPRG